MSSIMISIQPQWVEKILNGEKTIEIRKTMPKCKLPCKVYIYCTKGKSDKDSLVVSHSLSAIMPYNANGKVVAEFILNKVDKFDSAYSEWAYNVAPPGSDMPMSEIEYEKLSRKQGCMNNDQHIKYFGDEDFIAYLWHIDNLKIYDKPKELSEFGTLCMGEPYWKCDVCDYYYFESNEGGRYEECCCNNVKPMKRPPQSWCYAEEVKL